MFLISWMAEWLPTRNSPVAITTDRQTYAQRQSSVSGADTATNVFFVIAHASVREPGESYRRFLCGPLSLKLAVLPVHPSFVGAIVLAAGTTVCRCKARQMPQRRRCNTLQHRLTLLFLLSFLKGQRKKMRNILVFLSWVSVVSCCSR